MGINRQKCQAGMSLPFPPLLLCSHSAVDCTNSNRNAAQVRCGLGYLHNWMVGRTSPEKPRLSRPVGFDFYGFGLCNNFTTRSLLKIHGLNFLFATSHESYFLSLTLRFKLITFTLIHQLTFGHARYKTTNKMARIRVTNSMSINLSMANNDVRWSSEALLKLLVIFSSL
jgi:hypothetical protein